MTLLTKGYNIIKKLSGSSYLLEIDKLTEEYDNLIIILDNNHQIDALYNCLLYTSPSPRDKRQSRMPSSA